MTFIAESYAAMTAAEILAAEAAYATAQATAAAAAQQAAMELAAQQAAEQAAQQTAQQGIMAAPGAAPPPVGAPATPPPAGGIETVATPLPPATPPPIGVPAGSTPVGLEQLGQQGFANPEDAARFDQFVKAFSEGPVDTGYSPYAQFAEGPVTSDVPPPLVQNTAAPPPPAPSINPNIVDVPLGAESETVAPEFESLTRKELADYTKSEVGSNSFLEGFDAIGKYIKANPERSAMYGYTGLSALSALDRPSAPQSQKRTYRRNYVVSPNFVASSPTRPNPYYKPTYAAEGGVMNSFDDSSGMDEPAGLAQGNLQKGLFGLGYADGGITNFAKGTPRDYYADLRRYQAMLESPESQNIEEPYRRAYIVRDDDLDTRYENAFDASIIRLGKNYKRANIGAPVIRRPTPLGTINLSPPGTQQAASGGIMGYNLGGYADGGNPRLLKGPGDGMSDNIPAVIGSRQPARLADGEFVVPADVVSHLGNGSTDAGAKKLHEMMDKIRMARTGKKKQAPQVNTEKYLPMKKASGGIAGYAAGGITGYAEGGSTFSNEQLASAIKSMQDAGKTESEIVAEAIRNGISAKQISDATNVPLAEISKKVVDQLYIQQLGRAPDEVGRKHYTDEIAKGKTPAQIASELNRSLEGQEFDTQFIESQYNKNYARTADQEGYQYYLSLAQSDPLMFDAALKEAITKGTKGEADAAKLAAKGSGYTNLELASLEADPYGGRKPTKSIYDVLPDAENVSTIGGQKVQFVNPATQRGIVSQFNQNYTDKNIADYIQGKFQGVDVNDPVALQQANRSIYEDAIANNISKEQISRVLPYTIQQIQQFGTENLGKTLQSQFSATQGKDVLNAPANQAAVNRALAAGTMTQADYSTLLADLDAAKDNPDAIRAAYAKPRAQKVVDAIYGQQIGEAKTLTDAQAEATQRQAVLSAQDPGYYQSNQQLANAYKSAGLNYPFGQEAYQGYDTRVGAKNVITPENVRQQAGLAINELQRNNPYRQTYQPINRGIANMPDSVQDPYSDAGLKVLYGQMMNQYAPAPPGQMNPATFTPGPTYAYTPPLVDNLVLKNPITDSSTTAVAAANQARADAAAAEVAAAAKSNSATNNRAGGLMSINRKRKTA